MKEIISLNGKSIVAIVTVIPRGVNLTDNHDGTVTVEGEKQVIDEFKKKIPLAPSSQNPTQTLGKYDYLWLILPKKCGKSMKRLKIFEGQ